MDQVASAAAEHALAWEALESLDKTPKQEPGASGAGFRLRLPLEAHMGSAGSAESAGSHAWGTDENSPSSGKSWGSGKGLVDYTKVKQVENNQWPSNVLNSNSMRVTVLNLSFGLKWGERDNTERLTPSHINVHQSISQKGSPTLTFKF